LACARFGQVVFFGDPGLDAGIGGLIVVWGGCIGAAGFGCDFLTGTWFGEFFVILAVLGDLRLVRIVVLLVVAGLS
jgi:hypothetical protein